MFLFFCIEIFLFQQLGAKYIVSNELLSGMQRTNWIDIISGSSLEVCQKNSEIVCVGQQQSTTNIIWQQTYQVPKTHRLDLYIEYQISGVWNNENIEVYGNNILIHSQQQITLNDVFRRCSNNFIYESFIYTSIQSELDQLKLEIKVNSKDVGLYLQNIILRQQTQSGRNDVIPLIKTCSASLEYIQYYCRCPDNRVYQIGQCKVTCDQDYIYDTSTNECYPKSNCNSCVGKNQILNCNPGYYKYVGIDIPTSQCLERCPGDYYSDPVTMTCINMKTYLQQQNDGYPVDHIYFYKDTYNFFHFFTQNYISLNLISFPAKKKERSFVYRNGKFVVGSYETFQTQTIHMLVRVRYSQYKIRFRAIAHFIDFQPSKYNIYINGFQLPQSTLSISPKNEQSPLQDYISYIDEYWTRTELYPVSWNQIIFEIEQPLQNGDYQGYFYIEDIHLFQFRCITGCDTCYTIKYCTPCLNPANKNPADCTCLNGFIQKGDLCIECPTYCTTCTNPGICDDCKIQTKRLNSPACDTCPDQYYLQANVDNCQQCQIGCKICTQKTQCNICLQGYFKNQNNQCVQQCDNGYFNDNNNINNPICTICDNNCLKCQDISTKCIECKINSTLIDNKCYICNQGQYLQGTICLPCINQCKICSSIICTQCEETYFYKSSSNECLESCDSNQYSNILTGNCELCHQTCLTCSNGTANDCISCHSGQVLNKQNAISGSCQVNCITGFYKVGDFCAKCWKGCSSCMDSTQNCLACAQKYYRFKENGYCYDICPNGQYNNISGYICSPCHPLCKTCSGGSDGSCLSCEPPLALFEKQCLTTCPTGYGSIASICKECTMNCDQCFGTAPNQCSKCSMGFYYLKNQCYSKCPSFFIGIRPQYVCKCIYEDCVQCLVDQYFYNNQCFDDCPNGTYGYNGLCIKCDITCGKCFGEGSNECLSCQTPLILFQGYCVTQCLGNTYRDIAINECLYCDSSCLSCTGSQNNQCTSCYNEQLLSADGFCMDQCPSTQYAILAEKKCYNCHSSCLTCFGPSNQSCLTCKNLFYLFQCVNDCPDGFQLSSNQISCDPLTDIVITKCSYQCETCQLTARFCSKCSANRAPNPPNCDCENGYYDDGVNSNCVKCAFKCLSCRGNPNNCISCKGNRLSPNCDCPLYYYDDGLSVQCTKCQDNCSTCSSQGCITCLNDRISPPDCICPDGYFEAYADFCSQCSKKCKLCSESEQLCQTCSEIRINPPICECPSGYFQNSDEDCQPCNETCIDCNLKGCLSCAANRIGPIDGKCECNSPGVSRLNIGSVFCTDCQTGVPFFALNDEFTGFSITFGGQIEFTDDIDEICSYIFQAESLLKLGENPICDTELNILFGSNPNIQVGDQLLLNTNFRYLGCDSKFLTIHGMPLQIPLTIDLETHKPIVNFKEIPIPNVCAPISIEFAKKLFNGGQQLTIINWQMILPNIFDSDIDAILQAAITSNSEIIVFPPKLLQVDVIYKFALNVESFAHLRNTLYIIFKAVQKSTILFEPSSNIVQFHRYQTISIPVQLSYYNCIERNPPPQVLVYTIKLKNSTIMSGNVSTQLVDGFIQVIELKFDAFYFNFTNPYTLVFSTKLNRADYEADTQNSLDVYIIQSAPVILIEGGNRMIGYTDTLYLNATITDRDLTQKEALTIQYNCFWSCTDIVNGTSCSDSSNQIIEFDLNCNQFFKGKSFNPYQVFNFQVTILKNEIPYSTKVSIQVIELDLPILIVSGVDQSQTYNYYDEFIYKLHYPGVNPDLIMYSGALIYDQIVQATFQFYYLEFKFKLQNYFTQLTNEIGTKLRLRISIYDPRFIMPSLNTQILNMNIPPQFCQLKYNKVENFIEFIDYLELEVTDCSDENQPLLYSVYLYPNQSIYELDIIQSNFYNYILVGPPQYESSFRLTIPYFQSEDCLIIVNIIDTAGGINNITMNLMVKEYNDPSGDTFRQIQDNISNNFDQILIGFRLIVEKLTRTSEFYHLKEEMFTELMILDQNQTIQSNQTESLYHSISILVSQNSSLLIINESSLQYQLNYRISQAAQQLIYLNTLQHNNQLTSQLNIEKGNFIKQYYVFANILSSFINYRVARNFSSNEIQEQLASIMDYLQEISVANEPMYKINSNSAHLDFGFLTSKIAAQITGTSVKNQSGRFLEEETQTQYNSTTNFYKFSQSRYIDNPFYSDNGFPKNSSGYQAVDPKMKSINSANQTNLTQPMKFQFPTKQLPTNTSAKCIGKVASGEWNADVCKTVKKDGETICECHSLNPTSLMESLDYILDKAAQVYSLDTLLAFLSFPFYKTIVFYFYLAITGTYLYAIYWGMKVDNIMYQRIQQEKEAAEKLQQEEEEKLKKESEEQPQQDKEKEKLEEESQQEIKFTEGDQQDPEQIQSKPILNTEVFSRKPTIFQRNTKIRLTSSPRHSLKIVSPPVSISRLQSPKEDIQPIDDIDIFTYKQLPMQFENSPNLQNQEPQSPTSKQSIKIDDEQKKSQAILQPQNSFKIQEKQETKLQIENDDPQQLIQSENQQQVNQEEKEQGFQERIYQQTMTKLRAYIEYLKYFHQILSIVYQDDETKPRGLRASIIYTSIMGSLAVLFLFNQPNNMSFTLTLALLTAPINKIYQVILEKTLAHKKKIVRIIGAVFMIVTAAFISYTMLAGLVLSGSVETANQWSYIFIGTFSLDNVFYSPLQLVFQYGVHMGLINMPVVKNLLNKILDEQAKAFLKRILRRR